MNSRSLTVLPVIIVLFVAYLFIGVMVMGQNSPKTTQKERLSSTKSKAKEAKKLFKQYCVKCHGADGVGETPLGQIKGATDLTDPSWQERVDDQRLVNSITHGRGEMPAFADKLSKEKIASLLDYVRAFEK